MLAPTFSPRMARLRFEDLKNMGVGNRGAVEGLSKIIALIHADAITRAGTTGSDKLRAAIQETENFPGVSGKITIGKDRNAQKFAVIITIKYGAYKYAETIEPNRWAAS